jgi:serine/threonine protein kinase
MNSTEKYTIIKKIGEGGMAEIYLAVDNVRDMHFAIKTLNPKCRGDVSVRKRFLSEARSLFNMNHPNIIKLHDFIQRGHEVAFVMDYIRGKNLKDRLEVEGRMSDPDIVSVLTQVLDGLGYIHEMGLVHRDVKPSNLMIGKEGKVTILDFGIVKNLDSTRSDFTNHNTVYEIGTPMYMSPEQIRTIKDVTHLTDIYSLGVVLWQMVTGIPPYDKKVLSDFEMKSQIVNKELPATWTKWDTVIRKATDKKPYNRYPNTYDFLQSVRKCILPV